jgi:hypothetical protein
MSGIRAAIGSVPSWVVVFGLAIVILILRRPEAVLDPRFWAEDRTVFYEQARTYGGLPAVVIPYAGYLHVIPRIVAAPTALLDEASAALVLNVGALLLTAAVASLLASGQLSRAIPDARLRLTLGLALPLQPAIGEVLGTITNVQWVLGIALIAMALANWPRTLTGRICQLILLAGIGLTGPFAIPLMPLFVWARHRARLAVTGGAAAIQLGLLVTGSRGSSLDDAAALPIVIASRAFAQPLIGTEVTTRLFEVSPLLPAVIGVVVATISVLARGPKLARRIYLLGAVPLLAAVLVGLPVAYSELLYPQNAPRYFFVPGVLLVMYVLSSLAGGRRRWAAVLTAMWLVGVAADFRVVVTGDG